jgi:hypothetical protein
MTSTRTFGNDPLDLGLDSLSREVDNACALIERMQADQSRLVMALTVAVVAMREVGGKNPGITHAIGTARAALAMVKK